MNSHTIDQLLHVFRLFCERHAKGVPLRKSYTKAVREVANFESVTYQTIGDGCRRRLQLNKIDELYALLQQWVEGNPEPLMNQLKAASDHSAHDKIAAFFKSNVSSARVTHRQVMHATSEVKIETFSVRLSEHDTRVLRALAEIEGISPSEVLGELVGPAAVERLKSRLM